MEKLLAFLKKTELQDRVWYCGYVSIPPSHPLYGKNHDEVDQFVTPYGRVTFSCSGYEGETVRGGEVWKKDNYTITTFTLPNDPKKFKIPSGWWTIGFDTAHWSIDEITGSSKEVEKEFAILETRKLKSELEILWKKQL